MASPDDLVGGYIEEVVDDLMLVRVPNLGHEPASWFAVDTTFGSVVGPFDSPFEVALEVARKKYQS